MKARKDLLETVMVTRKSNHYQKGLNLTNDNHKQCGSSLAWLGHELAKLAARVRIPPAAPLNFNPAAQPTPYLKV